jgi:hypothetical protein
LARAGLYPLSSPAGSMKTRMPDKMAATAGRTTVTDQRIQRRLIALPDESRFVAP